ncbi:hypothetical protein [Streptomyces sp. G-G2]|uniref:hypothetical protein n=1 Tax=Streptomyces sp. G-G2 TaxID=3046201 RepID=UPI0024B980E7|nr:hypothetical protein [Streptomyces sp. G-G2]MDJ0386269.1 hypothetical protein [Streptomyces sp. G-G2]
MTVRPGGALALAGSSVTGPVSSEGALAVTVCHSLLTGPVSVRGSSGPVVMGDGSPVCGGSTFTGPLSLESNTGGVELTARAGDGAGSVTER